MLPSEPPTDWTAVGRTVEPEGWSKGQFCRFLAVALFWLEDLFELSHPIYTPSMVILTSASLPVCNEISGIEAYRIPDKYKALFIKSTSLSLRKSK